MLYAYGVKGLLREKGAEREGFINELKPGGGKKNI